MFKYDRFIAFGPYIVNMDDVDKLTVLPEHVMATNRNGILINIAEGQPYFNEVLADAMLFEARVRASTDALDRIETNQVERSEINYWLETPDADEIPQLPDPDEFGTAIAYWSVGSKRATLYYLDTPTAAVDFTSHRYCMQHSTGHYYEGTYQVDQDDAASREEIMSIVARRAMGQPELVADDIDISPET